MSDWIVCPGCRLKHSARADGACPRCHAPQAHGWGLPPAAPEPLEAAPGQAGGVVVAPAVAAAASDSFGPPPAWSPTERPAAPPAAAPFPLGARLAGWVLYANVLVSLIAAVKAGTSPADPGSGMAPIVSLVFDAAVATWLVSGREKARGIALVRVGLGAIVLTPIAWSNGGAVQGLVQLSFSLGLLLLLVGRPGPLRIGAGLLPTGSLLLLLLGLALEPRLAGSVRGLAADLGDRGAHLAAIEAAPEGGPGWRLALPGERWHPEKPPGPGIDRAVAWPEEDAHVLLFVKPIEAGTRVDVDRLADALLDGARKSEKTLAERERRRLPTRHGQALAIRCTTSKRGEETDGWYVTYVAAESVGFVAAVAPAAREPEVGDALLEVASGLDL